MGCWDAKPKTEEEIRASVQAMMKDPIYLKFFHIPNADSVDFLKELDEPVDYLRLME